MPKRWWLLLRVGLAAGLSGCAVGPDYQPPDVSIPKGWTTANAHKDASAISASTSGAELVRLVANPE